MEKYGDHFNIDVHVAVTNCTSIVGVYLAVIDHTFPRTACANTIIEISTGVYMEKYGDHFNIDVLVAVTRCTSTIVVYSVVIDHFFPSTGMC